MRLPIPIKRILWGLFGRPYRVEKMLVSVGPWDCGHKPVGLEYRYGVLYGRGLAAWITVRFGYTTEESAHRWAEENLNWRGRLYE